MKIGGTAPMLCTAPKYDTNKCKQLKSCLNANQKAWILKNGMLHGKPSIINNNINCLKWLRSLNWYKIVRASLTLVHIRGGGAN